MDSFAVLFCVFLLAIFLIAWKSHFFPNSSLYSCQCYAAVSCAVMAICACDIAFVLFRWSADDVRSDSGELIFYFVFSLIWVAVTQMLFAFLGVSLRADGVERKNRGALITVGGLTIGVSCCVAGSNVGNGPGGEVVLFCSVFSTGTLLALWALLARFGDMEKTITVVRDAGAGVRAGGFLAGSGAVFGAAVAGNWVSVPSTLWDFVHFGWPVFAVSTLLTGFERTQARRPLGGRLSTGASALLSVTLMIASALYAAWVAKQ